MDSSVSRLLRELDSQPPFALLDVVQAHLERAVDSTSVAVWLADYAELELRPLLLPPGDEPALDVHDVECSGPREEAFVRQRTRTEKLGGAVHVFVPVSQRAERLGVLEVVLPDHPTARTIGVLEDASVVVAYVLVASRRYTDVFERARRRTELAVAAELQWELLPVLAHDGPDFSIAGSLEPAYDIGGDHFDYAVEPAGIAVSVTDAMGHGTAASLLCTLCVATQRNARREGASVRQQARAANLAVHDQYDGQAYLTQIAFRIERHAGQATAINAGHLVPYVLRGDAIDLVPLEPDVPLGLWPDSDYHTHSLAFAPGDRLLLVTDGVLEAAPEGAPPFGEEGLMEWLHRTRDCRPAEVVRRLAQAVLAHRAGSLLDDATAVCVDYRRR